MSKKTLIIIIAIIVVAIIGGLSFLLYNNYKTIKEQEENLKSAADLIEFERKQTEQEFQALALEVEGYNTEIGNDSLVQMLDEQKLKIQSLLQELRTVKSTNAGRIAELKAELSTVRLVLVDYVRQVDSLNRINKGLVEENITVKKRYDEVSTKASILAKEKEQLSEVVNRASILEADNFEVQILNKNGKKTSRLSKMKTIAVRFGLAKNITTEVGEKIVYARIVKPNKEVLTKDASNVFLYENKDIQYSMKKIIEYKGDRLSEVLYWDVNETLLKGFYQVQLFADGNLIGTTEFELD